MNIDTEATWTEKSRGGHEAAEMPWTERQRQLTTVGQRSSRQRKKRLTRPLNTVDGKKAKAANNGRGEVTKTEKLRGTRVHGNGSDENSGTQTVTECRRRPVLKLKWLQRGQGTGGHGTRTYTLTFAFGSLERVATG